MNHDVAEGKWKQMTGKVRAKWGKLTDDDLHLIGGKKDMLVGKLQERYGHAKDHAEHEVDQFYRDLDAADKRQTEAERDADRSRR